MDLALNDLQWLICHKTKPNVWSHYRIMRNFILMAIWHYLTL